MTTNRKLIRSTGIIGFATSTSRVLGFVRDILFARLFGTNIFAQAFVVAFRLPGMLRDLVGEGATDAAIVPILSEYNHTRTKEEYWEVARIMLNLMLAVLVVLSVLGVMFAPVLVRVLAPGFLRDPEKFRMTVLITRWIFPYVLFLGMVAYSKGVLNSFHHFAAPAFAPVVLNCTMVISLLVLCPIIGIKGLILGVFLGGIFEVLIQIPPLRAKGLRFHKGFRFHHPIVKRIGKLLLPRALGTAVYQLSVLVDTVLSSFAWIVGSGGVAALYYSNRLVQLPLAIFGISLATAALPKMSKEVAANDMGKLKETVSFSLHTVFTIMLPAAVGLIILSHPIIRILFQRGEFTTYSTAITSSALFFYSFGLLAYAGIKILVSTYYAMGDTRTPVKTAAVSLAVNLVLNLILMWPLKIGGLALATSIAATTNFIILYVLLARRIGDLGLSRMLSSLARIGTSTLVMGTVTFLMLRWIMAADGLSTVTEIFRLLATVGVSGIVYLVAAYLIGVEGVRRVVAMVREKIVSRE